MRRVHWKFDHSRMFDYTFSVSSSFASQIISHRRWPTASARHFFSFYFFCLPSKFPSLSSRKSLWGLMDSTLCSLVFAREYIYIFHVVSSLTQPQSHPNITCYTAYISHCSADFYAALMWNATLRRWGFGFFLRRNFVRRFQPFWCGDTFRRGFFHPYFFLLFSASPSSHSDRVTRFSQQIYLERSCCYDCGFLNRQQNFSFDIEISLLSLLLFALWNSREFFFWLSSLFLFFCVMMKRWEFFNFPKIFFLSFNVIFARATRSRSRTWRLSVLNWVWSGLSWIFSMQHWWTLKHRKNIKALKHRAALD